MAAGGGGGESWEIESGKVGGNDIVRHTVLKSYCAALLMGNDAAAV
jgi:hypothetical protein